MAKSKMQELLGLEQSVWLDYLSRGMTRSGELKALIDKGLRGMTSNPTIFEHAIGTTADYDAQLSELASSSKSDPEIFETIAVKDVQEATDVFRPVYDSTGGKDGFVSLEVSPLLARDTERIDRRGPSAVESRRSSERDDQDSGHARGLARDRAVPPRRDQHQHHAAVFGGALRGGRQRVPARARSARRGRAADRQACVRRVRLRQPRRHRGRQADRGEGRRAHRAARHGGHRRAPGSRTRSISEIVQSPRWRALEAKGARTQRLLWASTGTKNPKYSDVLYVESLIGPDTISTVPPETLQLFEDHGKVVRALEGDTAGPARRVLEALAKGGIDYADVNRTLEAEGIDKFAKSYEKLMSVIAAKRKTLAAAAR